MREVRSKKRVSKEGIKCICLSPSTQRRYTPSGAWGSDPEPMEGGRVLGGIIICFVISVLALFLALPGRAFADDIEVNSTDDTAVAGDDDCTLREAINNANSDSDTTGRDCVAGNGADTITFSVIGIITLGSTLPNITNSAQSGELTIDGGSTVTISGGGNVRVLSVGSGAVLTVQNLTVTQGKGPDCGGFICGGGIYNGGTVTVTNSTFSGNSASQGAGGGIFNDDNSTVTVTNSTFSENSAGLGGGIFKRFVGTLTVTNSTFSENSATNDGGGIYNNFIGTVTVTNSTFSENSASHGGGIFNFQGTVTVTNSTFSENSAGGGGGIYSNFLGTVTVTNSTFSGNSAVNGVGGGILNNDNCTVTVTNSTFSGNSASDVGGGIANFSSSTATITNSIVANSLSGGNCFSDSNSTLTDGGNNIDDGTTCGFTEPTSKSSTDPLLDPSGLQDNGGPTQTIALCSASGTPSGCTGTSPAIDMGDNDVCAGSDVNGLDQRGLKRPQGPACDIGAFEAVVCGDGTVGGDEQCDDGNTSDGDCCSSTCQFEQDGNPCNDSNGCTVDDFCDSGVCMPGGAADCSDGANCTIDTCNSTGNNSFTCSHTQVTCNGAKATICGTDGNDTINGTDKNDVINGLGGNDTINGRNGTNLICGGDGNDTLTGGNAKDRLFGEDGSDTLRGNNGNDTLNGGDGTDSCIGGLGSDTGTNCEPFVQ